MIQYLQKHTSFYLLLAFIFIFSACEIINPEETIPSYIRINQIGLETAYGQGTASQKIVDAWIYVDDELIGAFELPATFPVIAEGYHEIIIKPGIELNGIAPTRAIYPFYSPIIKNINFIKDSIIVLDSLFTLTTSYYNDAVFPWKNPIGQEDFEESGITIDSTYRSETGITVTSQDVFEGNHSGLVTLSGTVDFFEAKSIKAFDKPGVGSYVFLELNYKTNNYFTVGIFAQLTTGANVQHPIFVLNPNNEWNKIYINLTPTINRETQLYEFNIFFGAVLEDDVDKAEIFFDNIKLVHF